MDSQFFDLLCIGGASADIILDTPRLPERDEKLVVRFAGRQAGGLVGNTACAAARLGLRTAWAGALGGDQDGQIAMQSFAEFGVDASLATIDPILTTDFTVILLDPSGERTILVVPTLPLPPKLSQDALLALRRTRLVYTIGYELDWFEEIASLVHAAGGLVAIDVEASSPLKGEDLGQALRSADLVFCSRDGLIQAIGASAVEDGARILLSRGTRCVCITLGSQGAWGFTAQESVFAPAFQIPVVDTTGAGDCFHAAFMRGYLLGEPLEEILRFANAAAALSIGKVGARGGLPDLSQVESFLDSQRE